ncbi:MAG: hypothetical protein ACXW5U_26295 [Thermoanaerobaculia bacterium]
MKDECDPFGRTEACYDLRIPMVDLRHASRRKKEREKMRSQALRATALFLSILIASPAARAAEDSFGVTILKAAGGSAAGKGAEFAIKLIGGAIYDGACKGKVLEPGDQYLCDALGGISGKSDDEWKKKVEQQLTEINTKLGDLEKGQKAIQYELKQQHSLMTTGFDQAASKVEATHAIVRIENLWDKYLAQFDKVDADLERDAMVAFAKDIIANNLHTKLGDLNVVLTKSTLDGQPLLRYPFYEWRLKKGTAAPPETFDATEIYDFAEKKFMDFRYQQHKVYVMYLWAATVLESDCQLHPAQCAKPPRATADFKADYDRYTRQQVEVFNAGLDWLLLSYSLTRTDNPRTLPYWTSPETALLRANFLSAMTLTDGSGWWGRVISMGNAWDGSLEVQCGASPVVVKPVMRYKVPVEDRVGNTLDWWVSRSANQVYDEVHFSNEWQVNHYQLPKAGVGSCRVSATLPNKAGMLPWMQTGVDVVQVKTADGRSFPFGSFTGIQRAGGTYALASGTWKRASEPRRQEDGKGQRENVRWDWTITTDRKGGAPWISLLNEGDGEWKIANGSSRVHNWNQIYLYADKKIYFPEGGTVKLNLLQHGDCARVCRGVDGADSVVMEYDVWNNDTESKKGSMAASVAVFFHPTVDDPNQLTKGISDRARGNGILIDGSYGPTGDQKTKKVANDQSAPFSPRSDTGYYLQYLIDFDVHTEGRFSNKTHWMYRAKITPSWLYLTQ